jgi:hypothetical protein
MQSLEKHGVTSITHQLRDFSDSSPRLLRWE